MMYRVDGNIEAEAVSSAGSLLVLVDALSVSFPLGLEAVKCTLLIRGVLRRELSVAPIDLLVTELAVTVVLVFGVG